VRVLIRGERSARYGAGGQREVAGRDKPPGGPERFNQSRQHKVGGSLAKIDEPLVTSAPDVRDAYPAVSGLIRVDHDVTLRAESAQRVAQEEC
jgi:hypothetical protein